MRARILLLVGALWCVDGSAAEAGDDGPRGAQEAWRLSDQATARYRVGDFAAALADYEAAFEKVPKPGLLFNIGQCHRQLGNISKAIEAFEAYSAQISDRQEIDRIRVLVHELKAQHGADAEAGRREAPTVAARPNAAASVEPGVTLEAPASAGSAEMPVETTLLQEPWFWSVVVGALAVGAVGVGFALSDGVPADTLGHFRF